jgi:hypothetical protein
MQILTRTLAAAALVVAAASTAAAQAKAPDFSGQWELNAAKSDLGPAAGALTKLTFTIQQTPTTLKFTQAVSTTQGDQTVDQEYTLDGKEAARTIPTGQTIVTTAKVEGGAIVLAGKLQGGEGGQTSRWTLAPDGKSMTMEQQMTGPMGALSMKFVLDKK